MVINGGGLHHVHLRKRGKENLEPFPASTPWKRLLDRVMVAVALIAPFALLPQVLRIYENKDAVDLSMLTWGTLLGVHFLWVLYGAAHREKPILIAHTLVFFFNSAIVVGILLYG